MSYRVVPQARVCSEGGPQNVYGIEESCPVYGHGQELIKALLTVTNKFPR
jgi:hypothetical protein